MSEIAVIENVINQLRQEAKIADGTECNWINAAKLRAANKIEEFLTSIYPPKSVSRQEHKHNEEKRLETLIQVRIDSLDTRLKLMQAIKKGNIDLAVLDEILNIWKDCYETRPRKYCDISGHQYS